MANSYLVITKTDQETNLTQKYRSYVVGHFIVITPVFCRTRYNVIGEDWKRFSINDFKIMGRRKIYLDFA